MGGKRRMQFGVVVIAILAAFVLSAAGSAGLLSDKFSSSDANGVPCPGFGVSERHYCLVVTTFRNLASVGGIEADLTIQNYDSSSLTNPSSTINLLTNLPPGNTFSFAASIPATCTGTTGPTVGASCTFPNIPGVGSASGPGGPHNDATVRVFFRVSTPDLSGLAFTATATAKESGNDNSGAANAEQQIVSNATMSFGTDPTKTATFAFNGDHPTLAALEPSSTEPSNSNASVQFAVPAGSAPFLAQFSAEQGTTSCFGGITCSGLLLTTDLSGTTFPTAPYVLWKAVINSTTANVDAIHTYDPVAVTASTTKTFTTTTSFAPPSCDGVTFTTAPTGLNASPQAYFVINATSTSFQVATSANGKAITFTQGGSFSAACIRVIGDQKAEQTKSCDPLNPPSQVPALYAAKLSNSTVQVCLWDTANGNINV